MRVPWIVLAASVGASLAMIVSMFTGGCETDRWVTLALWGGGLAAGSILLTLTQQLRASKGQRNVRQAVTLYGLGSLALAWMPVAILMAAFASDSC